MSVDHDVETEAWLRDVVARLHAGNQLLPHIHKGHVRIAQAFDAYTAAITRHVLQGQLTVDQGQELADIVAKVRHEVDTQRSPPTAPAQRELSEAEQKE